MSNEPPKELPGYEPGEGWEALKDKQWLMANGIPEELAVELVHRNRRYRRENNKHLLGIMQAWGGVKQ